MSVRLFHRGARLVFPLPSSGGPHGSHAWCALHWRPVVWGNVFRPTLALMGLGCEGIDEALQLTGGSLHWTTGEFWTTIRLQLPPCSPKKAALLASGLLKAARYADERRN